MLFEKYRNGNYNVTIYPDGTRIRETDADSFIPDFAECMDVQISYKCENGCPWCYLGCTKEGPVADLKSCEPFFQSLHPYTELALNMNFPLPDSFEWMLRLLKSKGVIANITVSQADFIKHQNLIRDLALRRLINGIGVSFAERDEVFLKTAINYRNLVVHTIAGVTTKEDFEFLSDHNLKILILGYKHLGRGLEYGINEKNVISDNTLWLRNNIESLFQSFAAVGFDNLALEQLEISRLLSSEDWKEIYSGDEGEFTFYVDLVKGTFAVNSLSDPIGETSGKTADEMFEIVRAARTA